MLRIRMSSEDATGAQHRLWMLQSRPAASRLADFIDILCWISDQIGFTSAA